MQHFQFILIILGVIAILAVLIHGYIVSRKDKLPVVDETPALDDVSLALADNEPQSNLFESVPNISIMDEKQEHDFEFSIAPEEHDVDDISFAVDSDMSAHSEVDQNNAQPDVSSPTKIEHVSYEPKFSEPEKPSLTPQDYFVFNVAAKEGTLVRGHELLQFFLTAGFRFGEMSIFHRHENSDGTGAILFSIANMMKPGIFDLDNMEQFSSEGVSFFLSVPNDNINIKKAFDMMLVAVEQMAEEFDCIVLNEQREPLTEKQFRNYHERLLRYI